MEAGNVRRLSVFLAFAFLVSAADSRAWEAAGGPDVPGVLRASEIAATQDNGAAIPALPLHEGTDHSPPPGNAGASPIPPPAAAENPAVTAGEGGEEADLREPSFGEESPPVTIHDPIEPVNRGIFYVNDKLYRWIFKPVAKGYRYIVPEGVRTAVRNFFLNLGTPIRFVNTLLQGKFKGTGTELARFGINTTIGLAGFFDVAKRFDLVRKEEDTGQTLGVYGLGHGMYIVLPILGPSSARDAVGFVVDKFLDPLTYISPPEAAIGANAVRSETDLSFRIEEIDELTGAAVDPYVAVRDAYSQSREKRVKE
ncbi:MAG: VacJ family lipoprotein [Deltaproteobacteria bacterium]|nr:VacJ family lipoprotein [Deltaproteobacteria bacterium]